MSDSGFFSHYSRIQLSRAAIGIVLFLNLQCAILFLVSPSDYTAGFELTGLPGEVFLRGMAILFLMWNVPYIFALIQPQKFRASYIQAILMQSIGLVGEILLRNSIPVEHSAIDASLSRFLLFDGAGLVLLLIGFLLIPGGNLNRTSGMMNGNQ